MYGKHQINLYAVMICLLCYYFVIVHMKLVRSSTVFNCSSIVIPSQFDHNLPVVWMDFEHCFGKVAVVLP